MVSKGMERVIKLLKKVQSTSETITVESTRKALNQLAILSKIPEDVEIGHIDIDGIEGEWIKAPNVIPDKVLLYLHGGAFIAGSIDTHRDLVCRISRVANIAVLIIDYRLAPEYPFPAALEDALISYKWLLSEKKMPSKDIIIGGDSAGGGLTLSLLLKLRDERIPLPKAAFCISPVTDLMGSGNSITSKAEKDPFLSPELGELIIDKYLKDTDPQDPLVSPLYADLHGLPPIYIQVGTSEILLDDSRRIAEKLKSANVEVELDVWRDMIHVFTAFAAWAPEGKEGIEKIGQFIKKYL
jgi:acetyl esterase/lipase